MALLRRTTAPKTVAPPRWPDHNGRVRVLVEQADPMVRHILQRDLGRRGYAVLTCAGPHADPDGAVSCPVLHQERCPAVDGADVMVAGLSMVNPVIRVLLRRTRASRPDLPIIIDSPRYCLGPGDAALADDHVVHHPTASSLARHIADLVGG